MEPCDCFRLDLGGWLSGSLSSRRLLVTSEVLLDSPFSVAFLIESINARCSAASSGLFRTSSSSKFLSSRPFGLAGWIVSGVV